MKTVVIPAAGRGTRFLPYTQLVPKELLPLLNQPALFYALQECKDVQEIVLISRSEKRILEEYIHEQLTYSQKTFTCIYQDEPKGLGHAILQSLPAIADDFFGVLLPDDIITLSYSLINHIQALSKLHNATVIVVQEVQPLEVSHYGIVNVDAALSPDIYRIRSIVEKPSLAHAPSRLGVVGRYWLSRSIFEYIGTDSTHGEIQLTTAIQQLLDHNHPVLAYKIPAHCRHDIGTPPGWLKAILHFAEQDATLKPIISSISHQPNF